VLTLPAALRTGAGSLDEGREWLTRLPDLVEAAVDRWGLRLGDPFPSGASSWCAPACGPDGADLVLKIAFPHAEAAQEAAVLRAWAGRGAAVLVDAHAADWALVLHRVRPGLTMRATRTPVPRRLAEAGEVLRRLHGAPAPADLPELHRVGAGWAVLVTERADRAARSGHPVDPGLLREAVAVLGAPGVARPVVLHGDLNPGNLLRSGGRRAGAAGSGPGEGWVAIDPKAMRGDAAYDLAPLLEQVGDPWRAPDPTAGQTDRLTLLAGSAGVDPVAAASWALARAVEAALWSWDQQGDVRALHRGVARAGVWARVRDRVA
jgi:streptomycin 6-kinase